ncbi:MAG: hypothetical protein HYY76_15075 [Acidobacteria bacterium]|nr:hypothetical protein [Acidobacteriota bacterium]
MQGWLKGAFIALASAAVTLVASEMLRSPAAGQAATPAVSRMPDGRPDLNGIWQALGTAHWNLQDHHARSGPVLELGAAFAIPAGQTVVEGNEIPYQPWAAARQKENYENWLTRDPEVKCYLPGLPRATYMPYPFQILQAADNNILMAYEYASASRVIKMGPAEEPPVDTWMGQSTGRWEGDTLVVDSTGFNDQTWFDRAGNFHSEALHLIERFTPVHADLIDYRVTIEDPKVFTRPWTIQVPLYRRRDASAQLLEFKCVEFVEELMYGHLVKSTGAEKPFGPARLRWP